MASSSSLFVAPFSPALNICTRSRSSNHCDRLEKPSSPKHLCIYAAATPPRRAAALSALATTSIITAATGGAALAGWSVLFGALGFATEAPVALMGLAAFICGGVADLLALDFRGVGLDTSLLPFVVFAIGGSAATIVEFVGSPEERAVLDAADKAREEMEPPKGTKYLWKALREWDRQFGQIEGKDK